jgi:hypothetical protein
MKRLARALVVLLGCFGIAYVSATYIIPAAMEAPKYHIVGDITWDGKKPVWVNEERYLNVVFSPVTPDEDDPTVVYPAKTDTEAFTYELPAIPAGNYIVMVQLLDPPPGKDQLGFSYDLGISPLRFEVTGNGRIDIDLPKVTPTRPPPGGSDRLKGGGGLKGGGVKGRMKMPFKGPEKVFDKPDEKDDAGSVK